jgi:hypothetical protein
MNETAQCTDAVPVPTAGQVLVRALPVAAVVLIGLPLVIRLVLDENGDTRTPWWPVPLLALFGLAFLVDRYAQAPRPRIDQRVGDARWKPAFAAAAKTVSLPEHPEVRTAVGVVACQPSKDWCSVSPWSWRSRSAHWPPPAFRGWVH